MSIKCCLLLVLLLSLSLHVCCARKLGPLNNKKLEKKSYASSNINKNEDVEKGFDYKISPTSKMETFSSNDYDDEVKATKLSDNHEEIMKEPYSKLLKDQDDEKRSSSSSWRVPHQRSRDKLPGFNVDYSPPKTHPPSHN
ncbi:hypothetical protein HS088_TW08G00897 [Tripterygium wilfordii]|uniref:Uncharacterized protein n=1 Tax=Tripterygium wilfordii TaxID=458696 RepID=A0A7J7DD63_TRIWF|nr:hypothetical protein HS088_TW08G00897 [Tripterygium wilfordii]